MDDKQRKALSEIQRALGILEGVSYSVSMRASTGILDAVQIIDTNLNEVFCNDRQHHVHSRNCSSAGECWVTGLSDLGVD